MDTAKTKWKRNLFLKAWQRCKSFGDGSNKQVCCDSSPRSKSWHCTASGGEETMNRKRQVAPDGCFTVYVGPEKRRFVVKTEFANHPLFKMLLQDAETEYGFNSDGPILLPCDVELFYRVLAEMDSGDDTPPSCAALVLCSPSRKGYGSYRVLNPSRMLEMNPV